VEGHTGYVGERPRLDGVVEHHATWRMKLSYVAATDKTLLHVTGHVLCRRCRRGARGPRCLVAHRRRRRALGVQAVGVAARR